MPIRYFNKLVIEIKRPEHREKKTERSADRFICIYAGIAWNEARPKEKGTLRK